VDSWSSDCGSRPARRAGRPGGRAARRQIRLLLNGKSAGAHRNRIGKRTPAASSSQWSSRHRACGRCADGTRGTVRPCNAMRTQPRSGARDGSTGTRTTPTSLWLWPRGLALSGGRSTTTTARCHRALPLLLLQTLPVAVAAPQPDADPVHHGSRSPSTACWATAASNDGGFGIFMAFYTVAANDAAAPGDDRRRIDRRRHLHQLRRLRVIQIRDHRLDRQPDVHVLLLRALPG
jgi:hypothetical protein